jgi:methylthioribose-1-phosphate isomerase
MIKSIEWKSGFVRLIDQTLLPEKELFIETADPAVLAEAICPLRIRGAPALGIAAAYGILLGIQPYRKASREEMLRAFDATAALICSTRPTAKNLFWAVDRLRASMTGRDGTSAEEIFSLLENEACAIDREDELMCDAIGRNGAALVPDGAIIITHCNTGALATGGRGTAQGVITTAFEQGKKIRVFADETRPLLQGARLTAWELRRSGIDITLMTDSMAATVMRNFPVALAIVGADRIAANGDTANKIGTYSLAVNAKAHGVPFYVAAPTSTIDLSLGSGGGIPIEERQPEEVTHGFGRQTAPEGVGVYNPAFDITPSSLIAAIITEHGVCYPPFEESLTRTVSQKLHR